MVNPNDRNIKKVAKGEGMVRVRRTKILSLTITPEHSQFLKERSISPTSLMRVCINEMIEQEEKEKVYPNSKWMEEQNEQSEQSKNVK